MNLCQVHLPNPYGSLPEPVFLPLRFLVEIDAVPPYCNGPKNGLCLLQAVIVSILRLMK